MAKSIVNLYAEMMHYDWLTYSIHSSNHRNQDRVGTLS